MKFMMMSPEAYLSEYENAGYFELLKLKNELVQCIADFENDCDMEEHNWNVCPTPDVGYQWNLEVLGRVAIMLQKAFNEEYEMGEKWIDDFYREMKGKKIVLSN